MEFSSYSLLCLPLFPSVRFASRYVFPHPFPRYLHVLRPDVCILPLSSNYTLSLLLREAPCPSIFVMWPVLTFISFFLLLFPLSLSLSLSYFLSSILCLSFPPFTSCRHLHLNPPQHQIRWQRRRRHHNDSANPTETTSVSSDQMKIGTRIIWKEEKGPVTGMNCRILIRSHPLYLICRTSRSTYLRL